MAFRADVLLLMLSSPGDVSDERTVVEQEIDDWNRSSGEQQEVIFLPHHWAEVPAEQGKSGQDVINDELVEKADALLAMFWESLGTPTRNFDSGTVEEIHKFAKAKKDHAVLFSSKDPPIRHDPVQLAAVLAFQQKLQDPDSTTRGLYKSFSNDEQLRKEVRLLLSNFAKKFRSRHPRATNDSRVLTYLTADDSNRPPTRPSSGGQQLTSQSSRVEATLRDRACIRLDTGQVKGSPDKVEVEYRLSNVGPVAARDVAVSTNVKGGIPTHPEVSLVERLLPDATNPKEARSAWLVVPRPRGWADPLITRRDFGFVTVRIEYLDDFGPQSAFVVIRLDESQSIWQPTVERRQSVLSRDANRRMHWYDGDLRPKDLTLEEAAIIGGIVRRCAMSDQMFARTVQTLRGDNQSTFFLEGGGGPDTPFERETWQNSRDFLPLLKDQGYLSPTGSGRYEMRDRLFEAFALQPPDR